MKNNDIETIKRTIRSIDEFLEKAPKGNLCIHKRKNIPFYTVNFKGENGSFEKFLSKKDQSKLCAYGKKRYYSQLRKILLKDIRNLSRGGAPNYDLRFHAYEVLPNELKKLIPPVYKSPKQICDAWEKKPFFQNTMSFSREIATARGDFVRSKNECLVANILFEFGLAYHYEERLVLPNGEIIFPDFTVMHPKTNEIYYIEVLGMMSDASYVHDNVVRLTKFSYHPNYKNLLLVFDHESAEIDTQAVRTLIANVFLN